MSNLSKLKRERLIEKLNVIRESFTTDDEMRKVLNEIESELTNKKFGLVWEEHEERVDIDMLTKIPVFTEDKSRELSLKPSEGMNFLIEGDNLHSLYLLEKTHAGSIPIILIDPPYNTKQKGFIYNDTIVNSDDSFRHSKWTSFMEKRLKIAKRLMKDDGIIFINIDDNEHAVLKLLCDSIFDESNFLGTITWEKRTKAQNTQTAKYMLQSKTEYILVYKNKQSKVQFKLEQSETITYDQEDEKGKYRIAPVGEMSVSGMRGRESMVFPILGINPKEGNQWKIGVDKVKHFEDRGDLFVENERVYMKIRPTDEDGVKYIPFWSHFFDKDTYGTAENGKTELNNILGTKHHGFETVKPVRLIQKLLSHVVVEGSDKVVVLDFFAGSGTTGHAVLAQNAEDGVNRNFILCTNNENGICEKITYNRLKNVITGYENLKGESVEGLPANLKYYKTDFIPRSPQEEGLEDSISELSMNHIVEMVQLQNAISIDDKNYLLILSDEDADELLVDKVTLSQAKAIYIGSNVLLTALQKTMLKEARIATYIIPDYYFEPELKEAGE